jgi:HAD superfamily hydrolase (TIGR01662 family)
MTSKVELVLGPPASGKTFFTNNQFKDYTRLNRDEMGGTIAGLVPKLDLLLSENKNVVLDNLFPTAADRKPFIEVAKKHGAKISCTLIDLAIEDCTTNACARMMRNHNNILSPEEIKKSKNPNDIPAVVLFKYKKEFQKPTTTEGFDNIVSVKGFKQDYSSFTNKAVIFDYDGTLREVIGGGKYPTKPEQVRILPGRKEKLAKLKQEGYLLLGASNQSGIAKGDLTLEDSIACFEETNKQLGFDIEYKFCPHKVPPINCFCRKPQTGLAIYFIFKYKLNPSNSWFVGDMTSDRTFATRSGLQYAEAERFFI